MPKFSLTPAQISDVATFLHARNRYVRYRQLYQLKDVITGDATAGEAYFNGVDAATRVIPRLETWPTWQPSTNRKRSCGDFFTPDVATRCLQANTPVNL